jgi:leader peptidase (prepilin peptidase)/N-methyltransferase
VIVLPATAYALVAGVAGWPLTGDPGDLVRAAIGLVIARSVYWLLWFLHSAGMGFGDVRLAALLGFSLGHVGWPEFGVGMYAGFLVFGVPGLLLALVKWDRALLKTAFPFGPFMIAGALLGLAVGPVVTDYLVGG